MRVNNTMIGEKQHALAKLQHGRRQLADRLELDPDHPLALVDRRVGDEADVEERDLAQRREVFFRDALDDMVNAPRNTTTRARPGCRAAPAEPLLDVALAVLASSIASRCWRLSWRARPSASPLPSRRAPRGCSRGSRRTRQRAGRQCSGPRSWPPRYSVRSSAVSPTKARRRWNRVARAAIARISDCSTTAPIICTPACENVALALGEKTGMRPR